MNRECHLGLLLAGALALAGCGGSKEGVDSPDGGDVLADASDGVASPDGSEVTADLSQCVPKCHERVCGPDGCGGSCGTCPGEFSCISGKCSEVCDDGNDENHDGCNQGQRSPFRIVSDAAPAPLMDFDVQVWPGRPEFLLVGASPLGTGCEGIDDRILAMSIPFSSMSPDPAIRVDSTDNRKNFFVSVEQAGPEQMVATWRRSGIWCSGGNGDPGELQAVLIKQGMSVPNDEWTLVDAQVRGYFLVGDSDGFWVHYGVQEASLVCHRYVQRFDTEGKPVWPALELATTNGGCYMEHLQGAGCLQPGGNLLVVNQDRSSTQYHGRIISEIVGRDGTLVGGPNEVRVAPGIESYDSSSLMCLPQGGAILAFSQFPYQPGSRRVLKAIALDQEGKARSSEYSLSGDQQYPFQYFASLADSGWFLTVWLEGGSAGGTDWTRLLAVKKDALMKSIGVEPYSEVDTPAIINRLATVSMPGTGRVAAFWHQHSYLNGEPTQYSGVFAQTFDRYGIAPLD